jgi:deoxyuridine 5'-triphosphate nucleotidohydrolase
MTVLIKVKSLGLVPAGQLSKKHSNDAGYDLRAANDLLVIPTKGTAYLKEEKTFQDGSTHQLFGYTPQVIHTGVSVQGGSSCFFLLMPRSGSSSNYMIHPANLVGLIDEPYTGELMIRVVNWTDHPIPICAGEAIAQLVYVDRSNTHIEWVDDLVATGRGAGGFGSTGA